MIKYHQETQHNLKVLGLLLCCGAFILRLLKTSLKYLFKIKGFSLAHRFYTNLI